MTNGSIEVLAQPRVDTLVTDAGTGLQRRRTEYSGTVWFGGRPQLSGYGSIQSAMPARIESPFFLPDSLPYRPDPLADAVVAASLAIQGAGDGSNHVVDFKAGLVPDPRNAAVCWIQVHVAAIGRSPLAISYRVIAVVAPNAILTPEGEGAGGT